MGGGNFGDIWGAHQDFRERVLERFSERQVIQFAQSIHYKSKERVEQSARAIGRHKNFVLLVRDEESKEFAQKHFDCQVRLCPDMAFCIGALWVTHLRIPASSPLWGRRTGRFPRPADPGLSVAARRQRSLAWAWVGLLLAASLGVMTFALTQLGKGIRNRRSGLIDHVLLFLHIGFIGLAQVIDIATASNALSAVEEMFDFNASLALVFYVAEQAHRAWAESCAIPGSVETTGGILRAMPAPVPPQWESFVTALPRTPLRKSKSAPVSAPPVTWSR